MVDSIINARGFKAKWALTFKGVLSFVLVALAVALPQIVHLAAGSAGGMTWLPMYIPVVLGGLLLGWMWGLGIGVLSPLVSFLITYAAGNPMPALARLPYMVVELAVFALISGAFSKLSSNNPLFAFVGAILAVLGGRLSFLVIAYIFQGVSSFSGALVWQQILSSYPGMLLIGLGLPLISLLLYPLGKKE